MTNISLKLECFDDHGTPTLRALAFEFTDDEKSVNDIAECTNSDTLRDHVKSWELTHFDAPNATGADVQIASDNAWSDALHVVKEKLQRELYDLTGGMDRRSSALKLRAAITTAQAAVDERQRLDDERDADLTRRAADRESRKAERADYAAWSKLVRDNLTHTDADYMLNVAVRVARDTVETFAETTLPDHLEKLADDPFYTLSWSGDFVQATADNVVAKWVVELFESGVSAQNIADEAMREVFSKSDQAMSRSTSVMSNATDDCLRVAWVNVAKRLTGRSYW